MDYIFPSIYGTYYLYIMNDKTVHLLNYIILIYVFIGVYHKIFIAS